jgi:hypothetical protein
MSSAFSEEPEKRPRRPPETGYRATPPRRGPEGGDEGGDEELPAAPRLGSLAQKARGKQLNQARAILIVIGVLTVAVNAVLMATLRDSIRSEIRKEVAKAGPGAVINQAQLQQIEDQAHRFGMLTGCVAVALGILFIIFGLLVKMFPVPITILSLVLYVVATLGFAALNPQSLVAGIIFKIIVVVALAKAIQAAVAYEKEAAEPEVV